MKASGARYRGARGAAMASSSSSINTNLAARSALNLLRQSETAVGEAGKKLSTGNRVNGATDNASTFSIAELTRADLKAWTSVRQAITYGKGAIDVALAGGTTIVGHLKGIKAKILEYAGARPEDQAVIQADVNNMLADINRAANDADFNGINLLVGGIPSSTVPPQPSGFGVGTAAGGAGVTLNTHAAPGTAGTISVLFDMYGVPDEGEVLYDGVVVATTGGPVSGQVVLSFAYPAAPVQDFQVRVTGPAGTAWTYTPYFDYNPATPVSGDGPGLDVLHNIQGNRTHVDQRDMTTGGLGLDAFTIFPTGTALTAIDAALDEALTHLGYFGRKHDILLGLTEQSLTITDSTRDGLGASVDADIVEASAEFEAAKARQKLAASSLNIANQEPQNLLKLYRG
jgi:flagellin